MALDPKSGNTQRLALLALALVAVVLVAVVLADPAAAALQGAAGGKGGRSGGFSRFVEFINKLADYTIPIGAAFSVLGLIWGGLLFQVGDQRAGRVLGFVALGVGIVLLSKPIAA